jgi:type I restriction enzyme S subunit
MLNIEYQRLGDICEIMPRSKRLLQNSSPNGNYPFYTSNKQITRFCNIPDYIEEYLIIQNIGKPHIHLNKNFSCTSNFFIIKNKLPNINIKYIYYYLKSNLNILDNIFIGNCCKHLRKNDLLNIKIPIISQECQNQIINTLNNIYNTENINLNIIANTIINNTIINNI